MCHPARVSPALVRNKPCEDGACDEQRNQREGRLRADGVAPSLDNQKRNEQSEPRDENAENERHERILSGTRETVPGDPDEAHMRRERDRVWIVEIGNVENERREKPQHSGG